jgi:proteasome component ECM29
MSSANPPPSASRELELVSTVELRIALASTSPQLQTLLAKYLPPLLLKLASPHASVRAKTREVCQHVSVRLRNSAEISLPLKRLVEQFRDVGKGKGVEEVGLRDGVRRFGLLFIGMGLARMDGTAERGGEGRELLKSLLALHDPSDVDGKDNEEGKVHVAVKAGEDKMTLDTRLWIQGFYFLLKVLPTWDFPKHGSKADEERKAELGLSDRETRFLASWLSKFLHCDSQAFANFSPLPALPNLTIAERLVFANWAAARREATKGFSTFERSITQTKVAVAKFLFTGVFTDDERFESAVIASADDTNLGLFRVADTMFKQCDFDLESERHVDGLYELYFGRSEVVRDGEDGEQMENDTYEEREKEKVETQLTLPARPKLQIRVLGLLAKSKMATTRTDAILRMVDQQFAEVADFGLESTKLRTALFNLLSWASRVASEADIQTIAPKAMEAFRSYIVDQGWPHPREVTSKPISGPELHMRDMAYENIGTWTAGMDFAKDMVTCGSEQAAKLDLVKFLFTSLRCDASSGHIHVSIESALGRLLNRLVISMNESIINELRLLLLEQINTEVGEVDDRKHYMTVRSTIFAAVRFANRCLPFADCQARWINLLGIGAGGDGERQEIVEEGTKGLDPYWWSKLNGSQTTADDLEFPKFDKLIEYFFGGANGEKMIKEPRGRYRRALSSAVGFCRSILIREALINEENMVTQAEPDWEKKLEVLVGTNSKVRSAIRSHLRQIECHPLITLINAALTGMSLDLGRCAEYAVEICSLAPDHVVKGLLDHVGMLKSICESNNFGTQLQAARLVGVLASHPEYPRADREDWVLGWKDAVVQDVNSVRGMMLTTTFILSRQALRGTLTADGDSIAAFMDLVREILLKSRDETLRGASHISLSQLMLCLDQASWSYCDVPSESIIVQLTKDAKKEQESAVAALGRFIRGLSDSEQAVEMSEKALGSLYSLHEIKRPEIQFAVGEALCVASAGWHSKATTADFDLDIPIPSQGINQVMLEAILDKVVEDSRKTKPSLKKASAIWLLCLIQYVGDEPCVQSRLRQCQGAFAMLLSDRDEIVQETGSRGLSLVYEMGDKSLKDDLVRDLVASFTRSNANMGGTVTSETELFDAGALPTGDGSVTTYQDIVSLATEMGDPSLVYRFMNLASNNAIWTSRSAFGRFGLRNVLADSTYLAENKSFYPKLYRYRFDPNPNVQRSMKGFWNALVKDSNAVIDENFELIIEDLLKSVVTGREWRVRQASCAAIADIIQERDIGKYEKYLDEIWSKAFKVADDIKESVRVAALGLCKTLTNLLTRNLEVGDGTTKRAQKMLDHAMPFLLQQVDSGSAKDVQDNAIRTLLKVIKKSPPTALRPYAPVIVETLIATLTSLEPESVNYIHLNAEKYGLTAEKLDRARVSSVSSSPAIQAAERCLEGLDENGMSETMQRLEGSFKSVIGLPSKVGLSSVLVTLTIRHGLKFRPYADRFSRQLRKHLLDRNDTITNSYCLALAYLMRIASDSEVEETSRFAKNLYFTSEEVVHRHIAGEIVHVISKVSNDRFMHFSSAFLPFTFIGRNDIDGPTRETFKTTWTENVGGSRAVLLYLMDIVELAQHIGSQQWGIKHTIATAIADLISCLDSVIDGDYTTAQAAAIWPLLEQALGGKTWDGKEAVVDSFHQFVTKAKPLWESQGDQMDKIALREAKRTNPAYRPHSISALGEIVKTRGGQTLGQNVLTAMSEVVEELMKASDDRMDIDPTESPFNSEARQDARYVGTI